MGYVLSSQSNSLLLVYKIFIILRIVNYFSFYCNGLETFNVERPGKNLCQRSGVANLSCDNQVAPKNSSESPTCDLIYLNRTASDCNDSGFEGKAGDFEKYGVVNLTPFQWNDGVFLNTNLNITFTKISWKSLKFRFVTYNQNNKKSTAFCRAIDVSRNIEQSSVISYDCYWGTLHQKLQYEFQYKLTTTDGETFLYTYLFQIPNENEIETGRYTFMILDITSFPEIHLKLLVPSKEYNVSEIIITLYLKDNISNSVVEIDTQNIFIRSEQAGRFISLGPYAVKKSGIYYFKARFECDSCKDDKVTESSSAQLYVAVQEFDIILVAGIILVATVCCLGVVFVMKGRKSLPNGNSYNILFVYEASYPTHIEEIYKFKDFLEEYFLEKYSIVPRMDLVDLPSVQNDRMAIETWYCTELKKAGCVFLFASPDETTKTGVHPDDVWNVNFKVYNYVVKSITRKTSWKSRFRVVGIRLPGCSKYPPEVEVILNNDFSLPEELKSLAKYLNIQPLSNGGSLFHNVFKQPSKRERCRAKMVPPLSFTPPLRPSDPVEEEPRTEPPLLGINWDGLTASEESEEEGLIDENSSQCQDDVLNLFN